MGLKISGDLTVDAPNATVNNYSQVSGNIIIEDISDNTWNELASTNSIVFNAKGKTLIVTGNVKSLDIKVPTNLVTKKTLSNVTIAKDVKITVRPTVGSTQTSTVTGSTGGSVVVTPPAVPVAIVATLENLGSIPYDGPGGATGYSNNINLSGAEFIGNVGDLMNLANWEIDTGTTNLKVSKITRKGPKSATIDYTLKLSGQGTGEGTISFIAKAAATTSNKNSNKVSVTIAKTQEQKEAEDDAAVKAFSALSVTYANTDAAAQAVIDTLPNNTLDASAFSWNGMVATVTLNDNTEKVLTFTDITAVKDAEALQSAKEAVTAWENEVAAIDNNTKLAAAVGDTSNKKAIATQKVNVLSESSSEKIGLTNRISEAQDKVTAANTLKSKVDAFKALELDTDAKILIAINSISGIDTAVSEGSNSPTAYLNGVDVATAIDTKKSNIKIAATIDETKTTISANDIAKEVKSKATATVTVKNAAGVELSTALTGDYSVTYNWTVEKETPENSVVTSQSFTKEVTVSVLTSGGGLTASPVELKVVITQTGISNTVNKTVDMIVTGV